MKIERISNEVYIKEICEEDIIDGTLIIPYGVTSIGYGAFKCCKTLANVTIPDSVTSIGGFAFCRCTSLKCITIPDNVTNIGWRVFSGCISMANISVNQNNNFYCDIDGVLFNKDKTELIYYPQGNKKKIYKIPDSVISIGDDAFINCSSLTSVTIPESVISIDDDAFSGCTLLTAIIIPDSVTSIGYGAFDDCNNLIIKCHRNSAAEKYAIENNIPYEIID